MKNSWTASRQALILSAARKTIEMSVAHGKRCLHVPEHHDIELEPPRGNFVTLKHNDHLRGCIGSIEPGSDPLLQSIAGHAYAAAFEDPRFRPLTVRELPGLHLSVSILSTLQSINFDSETALIDSLRPGVDGLLIEKGSRRATFLPAVWKNLSSPQEFLAELKYKAGVTAGESPERAWRYESISIAE